MNQAGHFGFAKFFGYLAISALLSLASWMLLLLPIFLEQQAWSSQRIGWAMGSFFLVHLVAQVAAGYLADRYGNVPTALMGTALACLGAAAYLGGLWAPGLVFGGRVLHGAGAALITASALIQLTQSVPLELRGRMMGYFGLPGFVMLGVGPLLSEWTLHVWGFGGIFLSVLMVFLLAGWILSKLPRPLSPRGIRRPPFFHSLHATVPRLKGILLFSVLFGFCFSAWSSFLAPVVEVLGVGALSGFGLGYALGAILTRAGISHRLDRGGWRLAGVSSLFFYGIALALIPVLTEPWHLVVVGLVCGMSHGIYYPSLSSLAAERFHPLHAGQAMSVYVAASSLGMFGGPPVWGLLADRLGFVVVFAVAGSMLALGTLSFVCIERFSRTKNLACRPPEGSEIPAPEGRVGETAG